MALSIIEGNRTAAWIENIRKAADAHTHELGFFPAAVFATFANKGLLYVLTASDGSAPSPTYAGHLLFDIRYPRAHVLQMFVADGWRGVGGARLLLDKLVGTLTDAGITAVYARVAEDLVNANAFWEHNRFVVQKVVRGGASKDRTILVRCRELDTPQLFPRSGLDDTDPLGLSREQGSDLPLFLLDMNVLFDISKPRRPRRQGVTGLFQAERMNICRLAISDEIKTELHRGFDAHRETDPMAGLADLFPCLPVPADLNGDKIRELAGIVFPNDEVSSLSPTKLSDLKHLACAIANDLAGLITNDDALLDAASVLQRRFGIDVLPSGYFANHYFPSGKSFDPRDKAQIDLLPLTDQQRADVKECLERCGVGAADIDTKWMSRGQDQRVTINEAVWVNGGCLGYCTRAKPSNGTVRVRAVVDSAHPSALEAARILLLHLVEALSGDSACQILLEVPRGQASLREIAAGLGFVSSAGGMQLSKFLLGTVLTRSNWPSFHSVLAAKGGPKLPADIPTFRSIDQKVPVLTSKGDRAHVSLEKLESLLCPALLCLPDRPAVLVPIEKKYAEPLLNHSPQTSLLPAGSSSLYHDKHYYSDPKNLSRFKRGHLMFFYESSKGGGGSQVVAVARIKEAFLRNIQSSQPEDLKQSVLTPEALLKIGRAKVKAVTVFDNIFRLPNPVRLQDLRRLGFGQRPNDLIRTRTLSVEQAHGILEIGFPSATR